MNLPSPPKDRTPRGLECSRCGCRHFEVVYTRPTHDGIARVRACRHCGRRITTRERIVGGSERDPASGSTPV
jgi:hypothetical protein